MLFLALALTKTVSTGAQPQADLWQLSQDALEAKTKEVLTADLPRVSRYANIEITEEEIEELVDIVYLESATQSLRGQQAVAEVILNRVVAENFPNSIHDVIYQGVDGNGALRFSTTPNIKYAKPVANQYTAVEQALYGPSVLPADVVYFSKKGENEHVWGKIGAHVFCYQYPWAVGQTTAK